MDPEDFSRMITTAGAAQDKTVINRIMLRFRPIAPKPESVGQDSGVSATTNSNASVSKRRSKRKYVRVSKSSSGYKRKIRRADQTEKGFNRVVTLQLLPERGDLNAPPERDRDGPWCNLDLKLKQPAVQEGVLFVGREEDRKVVETSVTVEFVTDTYSCMDELIREENQSWWRTDAERVKKNLEGDPRPGFISDGSNRVVWVNGAYKRMVAGNGEGRPPAAEVRVGLVMKEKLARYVQEESAFTCWVKLKYTWQKEKGCCMMVPCDVWRMECGDFAWKLDVEAALSLGR